MNEVVIYLYAIVFMQTCKSMPGYNINKDIQIKLN